MGATSSITQSGLKESSRGRVGPGVYFATIPTAREIGKYRNDGGATVVFHCEVNLGMSSCSFRSFLASAEKSECYIRTFHPVGSPTAFSKLVS